MIFFHSFYFSRLGGSGCSMKTILAINSSWNVSKCIFLLFMISHSLTWFMKRLRPFIFFSLYSQTFEQFSNHVFLFFCRVRSSADKTFTIRKINDAEKWKNLENSLQVWKRPKKFGSVEQTLKIFQDFYFFLFWSREKDWKICGQNNKSSRHFVQILQYR